MTTAAKSPLPTSEALRSRAREALAAVGSQVPLGAPGSTGMTASTPINGDVLFTVPESSAEQADTAIAEAAQAFT
ncbi:MAG: aldehyde dehydrogenase family protein, partial [Mycobacterium sp.]